MTENNISIRCAVAITATFLSAAMFGSCSSKPPRGSIAASAPAVSPTPRPKPLIAYLREGNICVIRSDGSNRRELVLAREGYAIQDFVWSPDGKSIYFSVGLQFYEVALQSVNVTSVGYLSAPPGVTVDYLEMGRDGKTIIVHALNADAARQLFALTIGANESRELTIDGYSSLVQQRSPVVRGIGEISVSPDGRRMLFKKPVGAGEELFVADIDSGSPVQITNLYELEGFEESVESEGGRRVIEAAWSPDGRYVFFNPMQSCSESMLCYGRLFLVNAWGGPQLELSVDMMVNPQVEWSKDGTMLVYDDGSRIVVADRFGSRNALDEGNRPKWQPMSLL